MVLPLTLPEEYEAIYEHISLATPDYSDYLTYTKNASKPVSQDQFIDVASFITGLMIPARLQLTEEERELIMNHHLAIKLKQITDALPKK